MAHGSESRQFFGLQWTGDAAGSLEEDPGYSPFTLRLEIAALLVAAELADLNKEPAAASYLRETADAWNDNIERWIYVSGTDLANQIGVDRYYVRVAPPEVADSASPAGGFVPIKNRPPSQSLELIIADHQPGRVGVGSLWTSRCR